MIGRLIWWVVIVAIAVIASFAQIDRSSRFNPQLAPLVPPALSGFAAGQRTRLAIAAEEPERALAEATALVKARPLPAENLELLAIAAAMNGRTDQSIAAIEAASLRGWRAPIVQQAVAQAALEQGEYDSAAQRVSALLATGSSGEAALVLTSRLLATPEGQAAFARRLAAPGHWQDNALPRLADVVSATDFSATMALAAEQDADLDCSRLASVIERYERDGETGPAARMRKICPA